MGLADEAGHLGWAVGRVSEIKIETGRETERGGIGIKNGRGMIGRGTLGTVIGGGRESGTGTLGGRAGVAVAPVVVVLGQVDEEWGLVFPSNLGW